jgi:hypothetical protein
MVFTLTTTAAMDNSAPFSTHPIALIYRGKPVQINRATSNPRYWPALNVDPMSVRVLVYLDAIKDSIFV